VPRRHCGLHASCWGPSRPRTLSSSSGWQATAKSPTLRFRFPIPIPSINFAVRLHPGSTLIGSVGLRDIDREHLQAELGFWIGREWWGHGYASEAAGAAVRCGFDELGLNRIYAHHMARNPAAGQVLRHVGMRKEGLLRERVRKWGVYEDVVIYAVLCEDK
jgi:RimJ/RimL family protein N-acetyltransferase